ncbi:hypothetical protein DYB37_008233 [Aphanomyces astaci]|uniref:3-deoxy-8-phosphooctulonate synthase n=1 Tax=Aphanomyces astaci TaxID=112090 RepID=A0A3R6WHM5_APHAT|nr:hypothetical protein DYB35_004648 [Aphanomyces astaci]RHZ28600.1 hypothetical protein DYB37_008233 [Aphanomyces astaci]
MSFVLSSINMPSGGLPAILRAAKPFFLIAGPCVLESEAVVMQIANRLKDIRDDLGIPIVFKASFDKANRQDLARYLRCPSSPTNQLTKNLLVGVDGLFIETHPEPARGLSDATTMLPLHELQPLLEELMDIALASKAKQGR